MTRRWNAVLLQLAFAVLVAGAGLMPEAAVAGTERDECAAPISTCRNLSGTDQGCPDGYACTCVPSCPNCRDCAARVCVPAPEPDPECRTACDCPSGLGCFDGQCIAGFAPVYCCEGSFCPADNQCQHRSGEMDRCGEVCVDQTWTCPTEDDEARCRREGGVCSCTTSCPFCRDCGPAVCLPPEHPTAYRCDAKGGCSRPGDRCICASSCPECDDCALRVCVPSCGPDDTRCDDLRERAQGKLDRVLKHAKRCWRDEQCVRVETSTRCGGTCGEYVNQRAASFVNRAVGYLDKRYCTEFAELGCPYATPRCAAGQGICVKGRCQWDSGQ